MSDGDVFEAYLTHFFERIELTRRMELALRRQLELQRDLRGAVGSEGLRQLGILMLYYGTPLTVDEVCSLRIEDVEFVEGADGAAVVVLGEDGSAPRLRLGLETTTLLKRYLAAQGGRERGPLFLDARGRRLHADDVKRLLEGHPRQAMVEEIGQHFSVTSRSQLAVLPTPLRLDSNPRYTGRGVTMAFIDSGFYPHPDIMQPRRRLLAYKNVAGGTRNDFEKPDDSSWHGMQTSVSAVGNGFLSGGLYRGIASDAELVLVQVRGPRGITYDSIVGGFEWAIKKKDRYGIRILNVSLGTGREQPYRISPLDGVAEDAVQAGIVVLVAAGNDGNNPELNVITPPASAPSVITVGGLNDQNSLNIQSIVPYHSNFGETVDGVVKPEVVAPGIWVAAPILPGSPLFQKAQLLWQLRDRQGAELRRELEANLERVGFDRTVLDLDDEGLRGRIRQELSQEKIIHPHYQHVDGTSFSSPIVGSVIAQMLEANPGLTPGRVKEILIDTAVTLPGIPRERQGFGMVHPRAAVEEALRQVARRGRRRLGAPEVDGNTVVFRYRSDMASQVTVAGSFNGWDPDEHVMVRRGRESWELALVVPEPGTYHYKFVLDGRVWVADPDCLRNEFDGFGGKNSLFEVHSYAETGRRLAEVEEVLRTSPPAVAVPAERRGALARLDEILSLETVAQADDVRRWFAGRWEALSRELAAPPTGAASVHLLYNMGVIVRTPRLKVAFDLVSTRHVLGVYWDVDDALLERTVDLVDVLFVSHRHADHLDIEFAERMVRAGKPVVGPAEATDVLPRGVLAFEAGERRTLFGVGKGNASLAITAHPGRHVRGRQTPLRAFEVGIDDTVTVLHAGDHDFTSGRLKPRERPDLVVAHAAGWADAGLAVEAGGQAPQVMLAHLAEVGHTPDLGRPCYGEGLTVAGRSRYGCVVSSWGESFEVRRA